jgi:hypothetical protein
VSEGNASASPSPGPLWPKAFGSPLSIYISPHAEAVSHGEAKQEEQDEANASLHGGNHFERARQGVNDTEIDEILAQAKNAKSQAKNAKSIGEAETDGPADILSPPKCIQNSKAPTATVAARVSSGRT